MCLIATEPAVQIIPGKTFKEYCEEYRAANPGIGCCTAVELHDMMFGAGQIFCLYEAYSSRYHDDYCTFEYFSNVTGEFIKDHWTTAGACPNYRLYECQMLKDSLDVLDIALYNKATEKDARSFCGYLKWFGPSYCFKDRLGRNDLDSFLPVVVARGRKYKGKAFLYGVEQRPAGWRDETYAKLYVPEGAEYKLISIRMCNIDIDPEACAEWDRMRLAKVDEEWSQSEHIANVSTTQVLRDWMEMHPEIRSAIRTEIDSLNSRREEYARQKHEKLLVWVREHFAGKTEEEWERIARAIERKQGL